MEQAQAQNSPDPGVLKKLFPLGNFPLAELEILSKQIQSVAGDKGKVLVQMGDDDGQAIYLITGKFQVTDDQGNVDIIQTGSSQALFPVSYGHSHKVTIQCMEPSTYFRLDRQIVEDLLKTNQGPNRVSLESLTSNSQYKDSELYRDLLCAYYTDKLVLPPLPGTAGQIQDFLQSGPDTGKIETILQSDMVMAALILRSANSPLFRGGEKIETIEQAITRLGSKVISHLLMRYSASNIFQAKHKGIALRCRQLWIHAVEVAAFAYVMAKDVASLDPEHAMTLGLMHDLGALTVLYYADRYPDLAQGNSNIDSCVETLRGPFGAAIFDKWGLSDDFVEVTLHADKWDRTETTPPDYADLIIAAQLYSFMGKSKEQIAMRGVGKVPDYASVPVLNKLGFDVSNSDQNSVIVNEAKRRIEMLRHLLWIE